MTTHRFLRQPKKSRLNCTCVNQPPNVLFPQVWRKSGTKTNSPVDEDKHQIGVIIMDINTQTGFITYIYHILQRRRGSGQETIYFYVPRLFIRRESLNQMIPPILSFAEESISYLSSNFPFYLGIPIQNHTSFTVTRASLPCQVRLQYHPPALPKFFISTTANISSWAWIQTRTSASQA